MLVNDISQYNYFHASVCKYHFLNINFFDKVGIVFEIE